MHLVGVTAHPTAVVLLANAADAAANTPAGNGDWTYTSTVTVYYDVRIHTLRTQAWEKIDGTDGLIREDPRRQGRRDEDRRHQRHVSALAA